MGNLVGTAVKGIMDRYRKLEKKISVQVLFHLFLIPGSKVIMQGNLFAVAYSLRTY